MTNIDEVIFSVDYRAVFVCGMCESCNVIKLWRPYLNDTDKDSLITLWEQKGMNFHTPKIVVSHDKKMIAIQNKSDLNKGWLLSIDNNYSYTVQKLNFQGSDVAPDLLQFTPDDECIIYAAKKGLKYWSVAERKFTDTKEYRFDTMHSLTVVNCSPNIRQLIVSSTNNSLYMKSMF